MTDEQTNPSQTEANDIRYLTDENRLLKEANASLIKENEELKITNQKMAKIEDARLCSELGQKIKQVANYSDEEISKMNTEQMLDINQILSRNKATQDALYKNIRAGNASSNEDTRLTVGSTYGKTREEILKSGGEQ